MDLSDSSIPAALDDDALRTAVRAAWGSDAPSSDLRRRVQMAMTRTVLEEPSIPETTRSRRFWERWPAPVRVAAGVAAVLAVTVGISWGLVTYANRPTLAVVQPTHLTPHAAPTLYAMLVARHDDIAAGAEADPETASAEQLAAARDAMSARVHHPVWVPNLTKLGWKYTGSRVYTINGVSAVVFNFSRGADDISAFSLPIESPSGQCEATPPDIDQVIEDRAFASFASDGELFALVGSRGTGPYPQADLRALANQFRSDPACMGSAGCAVP